MSCKDAQHYLEVYKVRLQMQNEGITNPSDEIKSFTKRIVEKLSQLSQNEKIVLVNGKMMDSRGNIIIVFPEV